MSDTGLATPDTAVTADTVDSLLDGSCLVAELRTAGAHLHLPLDGRYVVVALAGGSPRGRTAVRARWRLAGHRTLWRVAPVVEHGIVLLGDGGGDRSRQNVPAMVARGLPDGSPEGVRVGVGLPVHGLAAIDEARGRADEALALCPAAGGTVHLAEHLSTALVRSDLSLAVELSDRVLGPVVGRDDAAEPDAELLLATFAAWVAAGGSVRDAAADLGCHRNTVTNRLRRLEQRTGRRVDRPDDLVDLVLSLRVRALDRPPVPAR